MYQQPRQYQQQRRENWITDVIGGFVVGCLFLALLVM